MIPRYSRPQIEKIWSLENKFSIWLEIETLVAEKQSIDGLIPKQAAKDIKDQNGFKGRRGLKVFYFFGWAAS